MSSILDDKVIVALEDDKIIGFLLYQELWWNTPFLALVKIKKEYQRNWAWLELINAFETKIQEEWYDSYIGSTVSENIKSQGFLLKAGMNRIWKLNIEDWVEVFFSKDLKGE